ncbi:hypothetical protein W822_15235 [Advenella kashmirensis W13003]|uniref:Uncharacterized protein n=1 Tax=Advenella kashmirensis W13003 TaxID=1424334 RepID=V8QSU3_9BURK|nr:hypothetical protein W822_15235 [Advenella kashmirensis W13003]
MVMYDGIKTAVRVRAVSLSGSLRWLAGLQGRKRCTNRVKRKTASIGIARGFIVTGAFEPKKGAIRMDAVQ